eukprot:jgi/Botrbrau1/12390/Bobra.0084s0013.1
MGQCLAQWRIQLSNIFCNSQFPRFGRMKSQIARQRMTSYNGSNLTALGKEPRDFSPMGEDLAAGHAEKRDCQTVVPPRPQSCKCPEEELCHLRGPQNFRLHGNKGLPAALQKDAWAYTAAEQPPPNMMKIILNFLDNLGYEDKPLEESVHHPVVAAAAVPAQGGVPGPQASAGAALGAGAVPGAGAGTPAVEQAYDGPFSPNAGGGGRGAGRGRRPKEELICRICNESGHF